MLVTTLVSLVALSFGVQQAVAQVVVNGQIYTNGLAIVDAPQPGTTLHAGATQSVAIDISGDGHLAQDSANTNSNSPTHFDSLEVYLVSYQASFNLTVSSGPGLLTQESGSTVKHINWVIDQCIKPGNYNLTFYESSHINGTAHFTITPLPIEIQNTALSSTCTNTTNPVQPFPQAQSALTQSPFLNADNSVSNVHYPSVGGAASLARASAFGVLGVSLVLGIIACR